MSELFLKRKKYDFVKLYKKKKDNITKHKTMGITVVVTFKKKGVRNKGLKICGNR